jgi:hypothetical protein
MKTIRLDEIPHRRVPLPHHIAGRDWTASGYGRRIPSVYLVQLPGSKRWRRVYVCCYSNVGTAYVDTPEGWVVILGEGAR